MATSKFQFVLADSIAFIDPGHWDQVVVDSGQFMSRNFLGLLEQNLPENLSTHYALVYLGDRPVAAVVAQSLDIRAADLPSGHVPERLHGFWRRVGRTSRQSLSRVRKRILFLDHAILPPFFEEGAEDLNRLWPGLASDLWHRIRYLLQLAERMADASVGWVHLRFLVCGNLLTTGPHGVALLKGEDPAALWPGVLEALDRLRKTNTALGEADVLMIKDLTAQEAGAEMAMQRAGLLRFETEPNMVFEVKPSWRCLDDCLDDMTSSYRSGIRRVFKDLEASGMVLERLDASQVEAKAAEIHALYHQVHDRQKLRLAAIAEGWIPALARAYQDAFCTVIVRPKDESRLLGFITLIRDGDTALGQYIGFDKAATSIPLYLALVFNGVAQGIRMGASRIVLGRTALGPKAQIGARPQPMFGYLRHRNPALNLAVPGVLALLPAPQRAPERHPFKA